MKHRLRAQIKAVRQIKAMFGPEPPVVRGDRVFIRKSGDFSEEGRALQRVLPLNEHHRKELLLTRKEKLKNEVDTLKDKLAVLEDVVV